MPSPHPITIRAARDTDGTALSALIAAVFAEYEGVRFVAAEFPEMGAVATHFAERGGRRLVAESGDAIVGSLGIVPTHREGVHELLKVYVPQALRGRGIGHRLLAEALAHARGDGARAITLWSDAKFVTGHRFYLRQGFTRAPGIRALHDASDTIEFNFRLDLTGGAA